MGQIAKLYQKYRNYIENSVFVTLLVFYPFVKINQGLDVVDTSYSLGNFQFFPTADGDWMVATYLANVVGYLLMQLPKGDSLVGMYFYTGIFVALMALIFYYTLRQKMPAWIVFLGEILAMGLCWCPTTILYNYLTYLLMGAGILLLYLGMFREEKRERYLFCAGICLGANIAVRMPNVVQAAFVLALWYGGWLQKKTVKEVVRDTITCLLGYLAGFLVPLAAICVQYGIDAYPNMVYSMFAMTDKAVDYKPTSMITGMFGDYWKGLYWLLFAGICLLFLYLVYAGKAFLNKRFLPIVQEEIAGEKKKIGVLEWLYRILCVVVVGVLVRFYWGRGMFDFRYYNYGSMYMWAVLLLLAAAAAALWTLLDCKRNGAREKVLAVLVLLQMFLTPLGSNNDLYPIINNLFMAAPFALWTFFRWFSFSKGKMIHIPWKIMALVFGGMIFLQSFGFHMQFVFLDGVWGEARETSAEQIPKAQGIYTNEENADLLRELAAYAQEQQFAGREVILYGEIPGLSYFLDMPTAISTSWPDLDSYRMVRFEQDMAKVEEKIQEEPTDNYPVVIVSSGIAAYWGEDAKAYEWFGVDTEAYAQDEKMALLKGFLEEYQYEETFCNMRYVVYELCEK